MKQSMTVQAVMTAAHEASTPLAAVSSPDQWSTMKVLSAALGDEAAPKVFWDAIRGLKPLNATGQQWLSTLGDEQELATTSTNPQTLFEMLPKLPRTGVCFLVNAHRWIGDAVVATGVLNLRDAYKQNLRMLVLLGPSFKLPAELQQDVMLVDEAMPTDEQLAGVVTRMHKAAKLAPPEEAVTARAVDAIRGLALFPAEQVVAMSLSPKGLDLDMAWQRKVTAVNQTRGLTISTSGPTFADLGGLDQAAKFGKLLFGGNRPPRVVVWIDEIEKAFAGLGGAGAAGDNTGVTQDQLGEVLKWMESNTSRGGPGGMIAVGPPGAGKSLYAQALATTFDCPTIALDLGGMKDSALGASEQMMRTALKTIDGLSGGSAFVVATCNKLDVLPTELYRRFTSGIWYFDLPTKVERQKIWALNLRKYAALAARIQAKDPSVVSEAGEVILPDDNHWTGAEIRNVCDLADRFGISLKDAADYIVPIYRSDPKKINDLREQANGRYKSASYAGEYDKSKDPENALVVTDEREFGFGEGGQPRLMAVALFEQGKGGPVIAPPKIDKGKAN